MSEFPHLPDKKELWKSLRDLNCDPEVEKIKHDEFLEGVTEPFNPGRLPGISRRKFFALVSAGAALTATACSDYRDKGEIIPYNKRPADILPGVANYYASTCGGCSQGCGILIKTREGRPIKIDGNPDHPINKGKICATGQASLLDLYDPERLKDPLINRKKSEWKNVDKEIIRALTAVQKEEIAVITGGVTSPTSKKVLDDFAARYPAVKVYSYTPLDDSRRREAWYASYGSYEYPAVKFDESDVILALDSDFLGNEGSFIENMRKFSVRREAIKKTDFNRLYAAEGRYSVTGSLADYRLRIPPSGQFEFIMGLINELSKHGSAIQLDGVIKTRIEKYSLPDFESPENEKLTHLIADLNKNRGKSIVYAGETLPKEVHIAVNLLNEILGNTGLYDYSHSFKQVLKNSQSGEISNLIDSMKKGKVGAIIHFDCNPVYNLPKELEYAEALKSVMTIVSLTESENESSAAGIYSLPINHAFESWGDAYVRGSVYCLQQPVISPIFNTRQKESILLTWISGDPDSYNEDQYHQYLLNNFTGTVYAGKKIPADARIFWNTALHDGFVSVSESKTVRKFATDSFEGLKELKQGGGYTLHLSGSYYTGNGKYANNGWLQELPHPISKVTWDNYAAISPRLAKNLSLELNDLIEVGAGGKKILLPVMIQPGMQERTINIELGYGRTVIGEVGRNVGTDAFPLFSFRSPYSPFISVNATITRAGGSQKLISTQEHHSLDDTFVKDIHLSRKIIQEGTVEKYRKEPGFLHKEKEKSESITVEHKYTGVKWAMSIDLNKCTNCSACIASCNVENNIAVVGKEQVERGREMQWIRLDRYYSGTPEEPVLSHQPMLCQHCDNAPCENVCPVNATNHSPDGLNQMVYNRCVGTRYCSNNCPYKVRRFNFFNNRDHFAGSYYENDLTALANNPEVTVRSRGVMEKCSFCIQRIMEARSDAIKDGRPLKGSDVTTACQQACPTSAIVFGDANDPDSQVSKMRDHNLSYHVLEELNVKPNVTYVAKLRNTHSEKI